MLMTGVTHRSDKHSA